MLFHILRNPATKFSVNKFYQSLKSKGVRLGKDDLYSFLRYLEDAYLLFPISIWSRSEKKRMVNPKKMYVIDNGIVDAYSTRMTSGRGAFLENLIYITLRRQGLVPGYFETKRGHEVDFVYSRNEETTLVQVSYSLEDEETRTREFRALNEAISELQPERCIVVTLSEEWTDKETGTEVIPLWKFLLNATRY